MKIKKMVRVVTSCKEKSKEYITTKKEDEFDVKIAEEAYAEYVKSNRKSRPISELWRELGP